MKATEIHGDQGFGVCPACQQQDGFADLGGQQWGICHKDQVIWLIGKMFSRDTTDEEQEAEFQRDGLDRYRLV